MVNVPIGIGPQNANQPKPTGPAVLPTSSSIPIQKNTVPAQNIGQPIKNSVAPVQNAALPIQNTVQPAKNVVPEIVDPFAPIASKPASNSPWDDDLEEEVKPSKTNPAIVGSLDPVAAPLKVPENVEETVGKKIPASDFVTAKNGQPSLNPAAPGLFPEAQGQETPKGSPGILGRLFHKKAPQNNAEVPAQANKPPTINKIVSPAEVATNATFANGGAGAPAPQKGPLGGASVEDGMRGENNNSIIKKVLILIPGLVVVFALATLLTEMGLLSIGIENIYGATGVEQLWGGLSPKTETALGRSALTMQSHPDFKADGKIDITIDRAIKSDVVTPLLSLTTGQSLARDESLSPSQKATQTAADDYYFTTNSNSNNNSNYNSNSNLNSNSNSSSYSNANSNINNNSNTSNINSNSQVLAPTTGTKTVEGLFNLKASSANNEATIKLDDETSSLITLVNDNSKLFVKTNGAVNYGSDDASKWLVYSLDKIKDKSIVASMFNLKVDSGFSVKGSRVGNEKVNNIRCYKYHIDSLEIGSSLSDIGITTDMVPTLSGDVWIGIKDKLIHKMSIKITTPVSSAVRMVTVDVNFSDFDVKNSITTVSSTEQVTAVTTQNLTGDDKRKADAASIMQALKQYKADNKNFPVSATYIKLNNSDNIISKALISRYLTALPDDPKASLGWYYAYKSVDGATCTISARLENQSDTSGALVNNVLLYFKNSSD